MNILFLCTGNSCRSQMAEGFANAFEPGLARFYSAGLKPTVVDLNAVEVMKEMDIDISNQRSKSVEEIKDIDFDYVVTLCGEANANCPTFPQKTKVIHVAVEDPRKVAKNMKDDNQILNAYRAARNEIERLVVNLDGIIQEFN